MGLNPGYILKHFLLSKTYALKIVQNEKKIVKWSNYDSSLTSLFVRMEAAFAGTGVNLLLEVIPLSLGCTSGPKIEKKMFQINSTLD